MTDTLSDMLVRVKNSQAAKHEDVTVLDSTLNRSVCEVLVEEGFIQGYELKNKDKKSFLSIKLKYYQGNPVIQHIKRMSKSSLRVYAKAKQIPTIVDGFGVIFVSTSKGVMSHALAKKMNLGGELLFLIN